MFLPNKSVFTKSVSTETKTQNVLEVSYSKYVLEQELMIVRLKILG